VRVSVAVTVSTLIREVLGSNLGRDSCYAEVSRDFPQYLHTNAGVIPRFGPQVGTLKRFPIHRAIRGYTVEVLTVIKAVLSLCSVSYARILNISGQLYAPSALPWGKQPPLRTG
jgi:hypothetical protein